MLCLQARLAFASKPIGLYTVYDDTFLLISLFNVLLMKECCDLVTVRKCFSSAVVGSMPEWFMGADCKSADESQRWFKSSSAQSKKIYEQDTSRELLFSSQEKRILKKKRIFYSA